MSFSVVELEVVAPKLDKVLSQETPTVPENTINVPFEYLQRLPGNDSKMRSKLLLGFNQCFFQISNESVLADVGAVLETLHSASLLIDDIEDDSTHRRGSLCAHLLHGLPLTLNSGNLMYFVAIQRVLISVPDYYSQNVSNDTSDIDRVKSQLSSLFIEEMVNLHIGQGFDIYWRDNLASILTSELPTIEDYLEVIMHKTGGLFRLAVRTLSLISQIGTFQSSEVVKLANLLGIIYQIRDDYLNLVSERYAEMKGVAGEDLIEGKLSLPILYALLQANGPTPIHDLIADCKTTVE